MPRYTLIDSSPRLLPADLTQQLLAGTFAHALDHSLDHGLDLSTRDSTPHFTTNAAFIRSCSDEIARLFARLLYLCDRLFLRCGCVIRARLLARSETTLPRRRRPRWLARRAHQPVRDVRR